MSRPTRCNTTLELGNLAIQLQIMLPADVLAGQRIDINRPFGNGRDDDGDGIVDEPTNTIWASRPGTSHRPTRCRSIPAPTRFPAREPAARRRRSIWRSIGTATATSTRLDAIAARQHMARYLYVLAMLWSSSRRCWLNQRRHGARPCSMTTGHREPYQTQYALAQWADQLRRFSRSRFDHDAVRVRSESVRRLGCRRGDWHSAGGTTATIRRRIEAWSGAASGRSC